MTVKDDLFFPKLTRREAYRTREDGRPYANYREYKLEIREDCLGRCVYCDIHENESGGANNMCLDHFRPKSLQQFQHLSNDPSNLVWSCDTCNRAKWNHWPAQGTDETVLNGEGFMDPFTCDRREYFGVLTDGVLKPLRPPARYMVELLNLNRDFIIKRRTCRLQASRLLPKAKMKLQKLKAYNRPEDSEIIALLEESIVLNEAYLDFELYSL